MANLFDYLREHPEAGRQETMRATGASSRALRVAERKLRSSRRPRRKPLLMVGAGLLIGGTAWLLVPSSSATDTPKAKSAEQTAKLREAEGAVYAAMDRGDASQAERIAADLESEDPTLRLAAVRYLAKVAPSEYRSQLLAATDDFDSRTRMAAVQLVGDCLSGVDVAECLLAVSIDQDRALGERVLALKALRRSSTHLEAQALLPLLLDPAPALRNSASTLLAEMTGEKVESAQSPNELHASWQRVLGRIS